VELRHVEHVHLADALIRRFVIALGVLFVLRLVAGALLPLSADEAYYWLWSRHLAAGYYDHPPAIAWLIRAGTLVFGQTAFGVRIAGILLSFAATWLVWQSAVLLVKDKLAGATAALLFNLTLMVTVEMLAATPDTPQVFTAAALLWALAKVAETGNGRWWLAVGFAGGLGLLAKYSTLFLGAGALVWLIASPPQRRWLTTPWPYLGGAIAGLLFLPNILWNADHGWATFVFQFGRIAGDHITLKYLGEFLGAQLALATPFILVLGVMGLAAARREPFRVLIAALIWPSLAYFAVHALHDRVQGNWPCYLYPALVIAAVDAARRTDWTGWRVPVVKWSAKLAIPVAAVLVVAGYAQGLVGVVPMGRKDPLARLLAVGMPQVVEELGALKTANHADRIVTTDYATTAWFAFYSPFPVASLGEAYRWPNSPPLAASSKPALYIAELPLGQKKEKQDKFAAGLRTVTDSFTTVSAIACIARKRQGVPIAHYIVYRLEGPKGASLSRMP
jgi:4-amino-4-deoxy-L-arabinose transferase-like glycosyltransferase